MNYRVKVKGGGGEVLKMRGCDRRSTGERKKETTF